MIVHLFVTTSWVRVRPCPCVKQARNLFVAKGSAVARKEVKGLICKIGWPSMKNRKASEDKGVFRDLLTILELESAAY